MAKKSIAIEKEIADLEQQQKELIQKQKELKSLLASRKKEEARNRQLEFGAAFEAACSEKGVDIEADKDLAKTIALLFLQAYPKGKVSRPVSAGEGMNHAN